MERMRTSKESLLMNLVLGMELIAVGAAIGFVAYQDYRKYVEHSAAKNQIEQTQVQRTYKTD